MVQVLTARDQDLKHKPHPLPIVQVFDHQGSGLESSDAESNSSTNNSANHAQHPPSIMESNKLKPDLEEQHRIDSECITENLTMQHNRDLQIVKG